MKERFPTYKQRLIEIEELLSQASILTDRARFIQLNKEYKEVSEIVALIQQYEKYAHAQQENQALLASEKEGELLEMAKEEAQELRLASAEVAAQLKELLTPKDPNDAKNGIMELRAGTGGDEAAIWVGDLFRMYTRFVEQKGWKLAIVQVTPGSSGGYKEIIATINGRDVYGHLKYESGVHRVQRVPATETQGRLHTSAASVVVLPEMDEVDVVIDMKDIRKETFCSSGPGGQSVNTTYSAVRLTHIPTGITVSCQDEKSQLKNLDKALKVLRARLYERAAKEQQDSVSKERRSMVGTGDRSAKIRTYNYPRSAVTDHRIHFTHHNLSAVLDGDLADFIQQLQTAATEPKNAAVDD